MQKVPIEEYQRAYIDEITRIKSEPQRRIDEIYKYIEAIENGEIDAPEPVVVNNNRDNFKNIEKVKNETSKTDKPFQRPLYVRDDKDPNILHPYQGE